MKPKNQQSRLDHGKELAQAKSKIEQFMLVEINKSEASLSEEEIRELKEKIAELYFQESLNLGAGLDMKPIIERAEALGLHKDVLSALILGMIQGNRKVTQYRNQHGELPGEARGEKRQLEAQSAGIRKKTFKTLKED